MYTLNEVGHKIESADPRLSCVVDNPHSQIYVTSTSRPDVPDGIALLSMYYFIRHKKGILNDADVAEFIKDAIAFADRSYL